MKQFYTIIFCTIILVACSSQNDKAGTIAKKVPEGYEQIIPRGRIAAINNPQFVSVAEAKIPDDSWVFGITVAGKSRAYSLNILNQHEIVNDKIEDTPFSAVW